MANTYYIYSNATAFGTNKSLLTAWNGSGSNRILRISRIWMNNYQTAGVNGTVCIAQIVRITNTSSGSAATSVKHDTSNENIPAQITFTTNATDTFVDDNTATLRKLCTTFDEPAVSGATIDEWMTLWSCCQVWNAGYGNSNVQKIVCREGEGISIRNSNIAAVNGVLDIAMEITLDTT